MAASITPASTMSSVLLVEHVVADVLVLLSPSAPGAPPRRPPRHPGQRSRRSCAAALRARGAESATPVAASPSSLSLSSASTAFSSATPPPGTIAFFDGCAGRREGVFHAGLAELQLNLGARANLDQAHATGELRQTLLQLLAVVVAGGVVDLRLDLLDAGLDVRLRRPCPRRWSCRLSWR